MATAVFPGRLTGQHRGPGWDFRAAIRQHIPDEWHVDSVNLLPGIGSHTETSWHTTETAGQSGRELGMAGLTERIFESLAR